MDWSSRVLDYQFNARTAWEIIYVLFLVLRKVDTEHMAVTAFRVLCLAKVTRL